MPAALNGLVSQAVRAYIEKPEGQFSRKSHMEIVDPVVRDFILFCIQRQGKQWPALYDEMCWVAGRRLFRGLGYTDLRERGLSFSLTSIDDTIKVVDTVTASE